MADRITVLVIPLHFHGFFHRPPTGETAHPILPFAETAQTGQKQGFLCLLFSIGIPKVFCKSVSWADALSKYQLIWGGFLC